MRVDKKGRKMRLKELKGTQVRQTDTIKTLKINKCIKKLIYIFKKPQKDKQKYCVLSVF